MNLRKAAYEIFSEALKAVLPETLVRDTLKIDGEELLVADCRYPLTYGGKLFVFGSGKASVGAAKAVTEILGDRIAGGLVVSNDEAELIRIDVAVGSHPIPDVRSVHAAERLMEGFAGLSEEDFFIYLLSGGSSSLIEKPIPPLSLGDLQETSRLLLQAGAPIDEMNAVRKHLSRIKGGRLGRMTKARGVVLVISDVIGDDLETIGSAPLYRDRSSYSDVSDILSRYALWERMPEAVRALVEKGRAWEIEDTPKTANPNIDHFVVGSNRKALRKAKEKAESLGMKTHIVTSRMKGEAREVAKSIVSIGREILVNRSPGQSPLCLLFGGETTVTVRGKGKGGRNQELCLAALREIRDSRGLLLLSAGTDGIDGNSEAAGALVDAALWKRARELNLSVEDFLERNDSSPFLEQAGGRIVTGPTGTNVMDMAILLIGG
ncbi:MAG: putative hydroxypyruvate reductase [Syntrophus sp. PtaU1.Bin208]|nr:MAG: putative hydroxypyruvate reductase [Syntrophus sp. PtaU1.Bin208]